MILIEYLATKRNTHLQFVLALQWCRLAQTAATSTAVPLNRQQIDRLIEVILKQFIATASTHVQLAERNAAKSKAFGQFFQDLYELHQTCEMQLRQSPSAFSAYSKLMITSYRLYSNGNSDSGSSAAAAISGHDDDELQKALDFGAKKMNEKLQLQTDNKNAKKAPANKDAQKNPTEK